MSGAMLRITLRRSLIGEKHKARATVRSLGLRKINASVERPDSPELRGMFASGAPPGGCQGSATAGNEVRTRAA